MSYNLFLDDQRLPRDCRYYKGDGSPYDTEDWVEVHNFKQFYTVIKEKGIPKLISFDYQLNDEYDGLDCAKFLKFECEETNVKIPTYLVHSSWTGIYGKFKEILG